MRRGIISISVGCVFLVGVLPFWSGCGAADVAFDASSTGISAGAPSVGSSLPGVGAPGVGGGALGTGDYALGATQGGVQDMGLARELVQNGRVPPPEAFRVEGAFSEHDLGLSGDECKDVLCLRAACGVAADLSDFDAGWVQVGMSSSINPDQFERSSQTIIATIDTSGSMGWFYETEQNSYDPAGVIARSMLEQIVAQLGPQDRLAIVTYGSDVSTLLPLTSAANQEDIADAIEQLDARGSTNMEAGLNRAYDLAREALDNETEDVRVMLFTDVQPNVGASTGTEFEVIANQGAEDNIGLTVLAVGVGIGQDVLNAMSHIRGANAFSLFNQEDIDEIMADDWPYMVSPIAYDLNVELAATTDFAVAETYGFPAYEEDENPNFTVGTVFLSKRRGALLAKIVPNDIQQLQDLSALEVSGVISYETPAGDLIEQSINLSYNAELADENGHYFEQDSVGKTVALALLVSGMKQAAEQYVIDQEVAVTTLSSAIGRFEQGIADFEDPDLQAELEFANELLHLMEQGAEQGDLYGTR